MTEDRNMSAKINGETEAPFSRSAVPLEDAFGFLFRRLNSLATALFVQKNQGSDLTPMQVGVLVMVNSAGIISLRQLAQNMHVDRSTMQELVRRMVDKGLLGRRVPEKDKRTHEVWVTELGQDTLGRQVKLIEMVQNEILSHMNTKDAERIVSILKGILDYYGY